VIDNYRRRIDYLRISVTDRCNLHCCYCRPARECSPIPEEDLLSLREIVDFARTSVDMGVTKIRLTGGEPLMRQGIVTLVRQLAGLPGLRDFAMTTNGILLSAFAQDLAAAGLQRVNVSLDTTAPLLMFLIYASWVPGGPLNRPLGANPMRVVPARIEPW